MKGGDAYIADRGDGASIIGNHGDSGQLAIAVKYSHLLKNRLSDSLLFKQ